MARKNENNLTDKEQMFCDKYLANGLNGSQAYREVYTNCKSEDAIRAGASRLLKKPEVEAYLDKFVKEKSDDLGLTAEWILARLMKVAERCMQAEPVMEFDPGEKCMVETGEFKFDSTGANKALELLGKYKRMFTEKQEVKHSGKVSYVQNLGGKPG